MNVLNNYVIIDPKITETTSTGIILNDNINKNIGIIVALDSAINNLKIGDKVVFDESKVFKFIHSGKTLYACSFSNIICNLN